MIIDREAIEGALPLVEEKVNQDGWDQGAQLLTLFGKENADEIQMVWFPFPVQPGDLGVQPGAALLTIGTALRAAVERPDKRETAIAMVPEELRSSFAGFAFIAEGWAPPEGMTRTEVGDRRFADVPGGREVRFIHVVDTAGRYYMITRYRGKKARVETVAVGDEDVVIKGRVAEGLRDMVYGLGRLLPLGEVDLDAVDSIGRGKIPAESDDMPIG